MKTEKYDTFENTPNNLKYALHELETSENILVIDNRRLVARIKDLEIAVELIEQQLKDIK